jgi:BirA family transcriptional regulator, biotin operon repressor / biotin---[acetyl-CoA-carboxylase] ligase
VPPVPGRYDAEALHAQLRTVILGRRLEFHYQVGSTNDLAREAGRRGGPEGLVVVAEEQVAGRGRQGRVWVAPPGCCVLCSVLLRPRFPTSHGFYLTIAASLAIQTACSAFLTAGEDGARAIQNPKSKIQSVQIKWPNDVLVAGRKLAGVLTEAEFSGDEWLFAVVGFGINVNLSAGDLGPLRDTATSLSEELGRPVDRAAVLARVLEELEAIYSLLQSGQFGLVHSRWAAALETLGKDVRVATTGGEVSGRAIRVEQDGALVIRTRQGTEQRVVSGEIIPSTGRVV